MSNKISILLLCGILVGLGCRASKVLSNATKKHVQFMIDKSWTIDSLSIYQKRMSDIEIDVQYSDVNFNNDGLILCLNLNVSFIDNISGSAGNCDMPLNLQSGDYKIGFIRNYSDDPMKDYFESGIFR